MRCDKPRHQLHVHRTFAVQFLGILVAAHGIFILSTTLLDQVAVRHNSHFTNILFEVPLLIGISLLYLSTLLMRRKRTAWLVTVLAYTFYLGLNVSTLLINNGPTPPGRALVRVIWLPLIILGLLVVFERDFVVKSDVQSFRSAARFSLVILIIALLYGVAGFSLLDNSDFHQEINLPNAIHYTIDQLDLTTAKPLHAYSRRGRLFVDSLSVVSVGAVIYSVLSLFQPLRGRFADQTAQRQKVYELLMRYGGRSEDFFKLWPHDKQYFFSFDGEAALAFRVSRGVALCLGDPIGDRQRFASMLDDFTRLCFSNDWLPGFMYIEAEYRELYEGRDFTLQKLGQEAVLDLEHFQTSVVTDKYFRQIHNKFTKLGFRTEILSPPHHAAILERLKIVSDEWLARDGHDERGFGMGYYDVDYLEQCELVVARDAAGTIQAFINQLPAEFDKVEADFDMLRQADKTPGNINDFLLMNFITHLHRLGYQRLNMGLCALTGLDDTDAERQGLIDTALKIAYTNGDRFFSFSGLYRFKSKYQPDWRDRYVAYQGGVRGFSRTLSSLLRSMRVKIKK